MSRLTFQNLLLRGFLAFSQLSFVNHQKVSRNTQYIFPVTEDFHRPRSNELNFNSCQFLFLQFVTAEF